VNDITKGINLALSGLYGQENVFYGNARDAVRPYVTFNMLPTVPSEYTACTRSTGDNAGVITTFPFTIIYWADTDQEARDRIVQIIDRFEETDVTLVTDHLLMTEVVSQSVIEDPDQSFDGQTVWAGTAIIEFKISKGA